MQRNKALQADLITTLEHIKSELTAQNRKIYEKDLDALKETIQGSLKESTYSNSSFFDKNIIVKAIMIIIQKIDKEIAAVEKEMHGIEFYPSKTGRLKDITFKQSIKDELTKMCDKVIGARHEVHDMFQTIGRRLK